MEALAERHQLLLAALILVFSSLPFLSVIDDPPHSDVQIYKAAADHIRTGSMPYKDFVLEYPPYAIPLFLLPIVLGEENYAMAFKLLALLADVGIKCLLIVIGLREARGFRSLLPLAMYCGALPFIKYFFLQRFDVFPALISVVALWLFFSRRYGLAGLMIALGAGMKLYPALFAPALLVLAWGEQRARSFVLGLAAGLAPLLLLGLSLPWWSFLAFHSERGLQAESLYASLIWLLHYFGIGDAVWEGGTRCYEVHGAIADSVIPWARAWFACAVVGSIILSCWAATRGQAILIEGREPSRVARLLLIPLLAFVVFSQVFSPQFMIWLLPLAAIASVHGKPWISITVCLATLCIPGFYPSPEYHTAGLNLVQTSMLVMRNGTLLTAWVFLVFELLAVARRG